MQSNPETAWIVGTSAFLTVFGALSASFDPTLAFALSIAVLAIVKKF
jgi:hypothetical protein